METQMKQRVFTGVVTQLQDNYGMVDQDVHFQMSDVIGRYPQLGEKVLVKAVKDSAQALSWTAQTVQTLNGQPFKSPPPLLPSMSSNQKPGILGRQPQPLLKSPKIPPLIPNMQSNPGKGLLQMPHHLQPQWGAPYEGWGGGGSSRKRHSEGGGGRRGGRWEDGGPWGGDGIHQKRRRWKGMSDDEAPRKSTSAPQQSYPLFSFFPRDSSACESLEVRRRYPHLPLPPSLLHLQLSWTESFPPDRPLPLCGPCLFRAGPSQTPEQPEASETEGPEAPEAPNSEFAVKVMLLSMPSMEELYTECCLLGQEDQGSKGGAVHPSTLIKFLLLESKGNMQLVGGHYSAQDDGPSPAKDPSSLIRTAVRCTLQQTGLDLGPCTQWHRMAEMRYLSEERVETVVFLLPDVWNLPHTVPEEETPKEEEPEEQEDSTPTLPVPPALLVTPCPGSTLPVLSLASLLEPANSKTQEAFEVGLMAELFCEMLQRDFGLQLYRCLSCLPLSPASKADQTEDRAPETSEAAAGSTKEPKKNEKGKRRAASKEGKKRRGSVEKEEEEEKEKKEEEGEEEKKAKPEAVEETEDLAEDKKNSESDVAEVLGEDEKTAAVADNHTTKENDRPLGWSAALPRSVLLSWVFFDRKLEGSLREQDLQNILLSLGLYLTPAQAMELVKKATVSDLCQYRKLCTQWDDSDLPCDISLQGNQALLPGQASTVKERAPSRRSGAKGSSTDMVNYKGSMVNLPSLMQALEKGTAVQRALEQRVSTLQTKLVEVQLGKEAQEEQQGAEELRSRLEQAEKLNKLYERNLKENAGHMLAVIEKMQKMVDQTTSLTDSKKTKDEKA
ncbi:cell cycle and apoptosis regulator protein 2 isoform X1 [Alosa sapidissima]|uniref:cell cycle and apoptosis regulator protein 2 isoform X1 n=1 Tax=Alosa sapidissima TaxID=34773 RepID=UPI001C089A88|nr:cell cycle and apoptosis regulator protein 2 isoform X1 [Alosa sapidissima]